MRIVWFASAYGICNCDVCRLHFAICAVDSASDIGRDFASPTFLLIKRAVWAWDIAKQSDRGWSCWRLVVLSAGMLPMSVARIASTCRCLRDRGFG